MWRGPHRKALFEVSEALNNRITAVLVVRFRGQECPRHTFLSPWLGFRGQEFLRLRSEFVTFCFYSKSDAENRGLASEKSPINQKSHALSG
jgi:hypothetical protein